MQIQSIGDMFQKSLSFIHIHITQFFFSQLAAMHTVTDSIDTENIMFSSSIKKILSDIKRCPAALSYLKEAEKLQSATETSQRKEKITEGSHDLTQQKCKDEQMIQEQPDQQVKTHGNVSRQSKTRGRNMSISGLKKHDAIKL